jgi:hypothetical protein
MTSDRSVESNHIGLGGISRSRAFFAALSSLIQYLFLIEFCYSLLGDSRAHHLWMRRFLATPDEESKVQNPRQKPPDLIPTTIAISLIVEIFLCHLGSTSFQHNHVLGVHSCRL